MANSTKRKSWFARIAIRLRGGKVYQQAYDDTNARQETHDVSTLFGFSPEILRHDANMANRTLHSLD